MKKVAVLLSAYNGEKYIEAQIESVLNQTYPNLVLYVRDDGSKDKTVQILKRYEEEGKIRYFEGGNLGFVKSFLWLLKNCEEADYYAFCDQDDVWKPEKIARAVTMMEKENDAHPLVYCSSFDVCNGELQVKEKVPDLFRPFTIQKTITSGDTGFGITQVFNNAVRKMIQDRPSPGLSRVFGHDTMIHLIGVCWGKVLYDNASTVWYRRHGNNTSTQEYHGGSRFTHQLWRIKEFLFHSNGKRIYEDAREFYELYRKELSPSDCEIFECYLDPGYKPGKVWKKVMYRGRYRRSAVDDIALRVLFVIHKM